MTSRDNILIKKYFDSFLRIDNYFIIFLKRKLYLFIRNKKTKQKIF